MTEYSDDTFLCILIRCQNPTNFSPIQINEHCFAPNESKIVHKTNVIDNSTRWSPCILKCTPVVQVMF